MDRINLEHTTANHSRRIRLPMLETDLHTELSEDFTLPDYQPEIRRLLRISAVVRPPAKFIGTGDAEFSGNIDLTVIYTGNDGSLASAPLSAEYRFRVPLDAGSDFDLSDAPSVFAFPTVETLNGRVTAPRRLTVKCRLSTKVRCHATCLIGERYNGEILPENEQCRLTGECENAVVTGGMEEGLTLTDEILPDVSTDGLRVISADGRVFVSDAVAGSGEVRCRGDAIITLTVAKEAVEPVGTDSDTFRLTADVDTEAEAPDSGAQAKHPAPELLVLTRKLPFTAEIPTEGADVSCSAAAWGTCTDLSVSVEDGKILVDAGLTLESLCQKRERAEYTKDIYGVGRDSVCTYVERSIPAAVCTGNGNLTVGGSTALSDLGIRPGAKVLEVTGDAKVTGLSAEKGKAVLSGECRFRMLIAGTDGEVSAADAVFPFRYVCDGERAVDGLDEGSLSGDVMADLMTCRARIDGERLAADGEAAIAFRLSGTRKIRMPETVRFGEKIHSSPSDVRVCFPAPGDTLWDTAKRFAVPVSTLAEKNDLPPAVRADDPSSLGKNRFLIV